MALVAAGLRPATAQEQAPTRREFTVTAKDGRFAAQRLEVSQDDLVRITLHADDRAHGFAIDEYRIVKRVPAGGTTTFEFRADRTGTFPFYCTITGESGHDGERGQLVVRPR